MKKRKEHIKITPSAVPGHVHLSMFWPVTPDAASQIKGILEAYGMKGGERPVEHTPPAKGS